MDTVARPQAHIQLRGSAAVFQRQTVDHVIHLIAYGVINLITHRAINLNAYRVINLGAYRVINLNPYRVINLIAHRAINLTAYRAINLIAYSAVNLNAYRVINLIAYRVLSVAGLPCERGSRSIQLQLQLPCRVAYSALRKVRGFTDTIFSFYFVCSVVF